MYEKSFINIFPVTQLTLMILTSDASLSNASSNKPNFLGAAILGSDYRINLVLNQVLRMGFTNDEKMM